MKFGIGQPVRRTEGLRLITGRGLYTDDIVLPRTAQAFVLRSPVAHGNVKRIDTAAARGTPGVDQCDCRRAASQEWLTAHRHAGDAAQSVGSDQRAVRG
jgi:xanthine dehydrogenase molybdopterin-binding subunit B